MGNIVKKSTDINRRALVICLVFLTLMASCAVCAAQNATALSPSSVSVNYGLTYTDKTLRPGDDGIAYITIQNSGGLAAKNVEAWLLSSNDVTVESIGKKYLGTLSPASTITTTYDISVSNTASTGKSMLRLSLSYDAYYYDASGVLRSEGKSGDWSIPITISSSPVFTVEPVSGTDVQTGNKFQIKIELENKNAAIYEASAQLSGATTSAGAQAITILGSDIEYLGDIKKDTVTDITFDAYASSDTVTGAYSLPLVITYEDSDHNEAQETFSIGVYVSKSTEENMRIVDVGCAPSSPGSDADLTVTVLNTGNNGARDVSVEIDFGSMFTPMKTSDVYLGGLASDERKTASFDVSISSDAEIKTYQLPVTITYFDSDGAEQTVDKVIGVSVKAEPGISIGVDQATKGAVVVRVVNSDVAPAKFVSISLASTDMFDVTSATDVYLGNMNPDDYETVEYSLYLKGTESGGTITLPFTLSYKDDRNNPYTDSENIILNPYMVGEIEGANGEDNSGTIIGVLVLVIVVLLVIFRQSLYEKLKSGP